MDLDQLDAALAIADGRVVANGAALPAALDGLATFDGGRPITIEGATKTRASTTLTIAGAADFMNVPAAPTTATFTLAPDGSAAAMLRFELIGAEPGDDPWTFAKSFPGLPAFPLADDERQARLLDNLELRNAAFILCSADGIDPATGVSLRRGLNFVSDLVPAGIADLVDTLAAGRDTIKLHGTIVPPPANGASATDDGEAGDGAVPGISLSAPLGDDISFQGATIERPRLRLFSPLAPDSGTAQPELGITARARLEDVDATATLSGSFTPGSNRVVVTGSLRGAVITADALARVVPGHDFRNDLPAEVRDAIGSAALALQSVTIVLVAGQAPSIDLIKVVVGFTGVNWSVFPHTAVRLDAAELTVATPFKPGGGSPAVTLLGAIVLGDAELSLFTEVPDFTVRARLERQATLPLDALFTRYLPDIPPPPGLAVDALELVVTPGKSFAASATMAEDPPWTLALGRTAMTIANVELDVEKESDQPATGKFSGTLGLGGLELDASYDLPGSLEVRAGLPEMKLSQLVGLFDEAGIGLPAGFDPALGESYMLLSERDGETTFTAVADVTGLGLLAFTAQRENGRTGVAVGIELDDVPSMVQGLGALSAIESLIGLEKVMLVASSLDDPGFQFPDMAAFRTPSLSAAGDLKLPPQATGLVRGLNFYAQLSTTRSAAFQALASYLGVSLDGTVGVTLAVSLPDPSASSRLFLSVEQRLDEITTVEGELGVLLVNGEPGGFLTGTVRTEIDGTPVTFDATAALLANGAVISGTMKGTVDVGALLLSNLALVVGMDLEGVPSFGIAATIDVEGSAFESSVAVFFDSTNPRNSMVAGSISDISLADVVEALSGQDDVPPQVADVLRSIGLRGLGAFTMPATRADALDSRGIADVAAAFQQHGGIALPSTSEQVLLVVDEPGAIWHLTDLSTMRHYSLRRDGDVIGVTLDPQLYLAPQDTRIGTLAFPAGMRVEAEIDVVVSARIDMEVSERGVAADATLDRIVVFNEDLLAITDASGQAGPSLSLATYPRPDAPEKLRDPHVYVSGRLRMLGIDLLDVHVDATAQGIAIDVAVQLTPAVHVAVLGHATGPDDFDAKAIVSVGVNASLDFGPLGRLALNASADGSVAIEVNRDGARVALDGSLSFAGERYSLPTMALPIASDTFARLDDLIAQEARAIFEPMLRDAELWIRWVDGGLMQGMQSAEQIAGVLAGQFAVGAEDAVRMLRNLGYRTDEIVDAIRSAFNVGAATMIQWATLFGVGAQDVALAVQREFELDTAGLVGTMRNAGLDVGAAMGVLRSMGTAFESLTSSLLAGGFDADDVMALIPGGAIGIAQLYRAAGTAPEVIAGYLTQTYQIDPAAAALALKQIGVPAEQVTSALRSTFAWPAEQTVAFLRDAYEMSDEAARQTMQAADQAAGFFRDAGHQIEQGLHEAGHEIEQGVKTVGDTLSHALNPSNW